MEIKDKVVVITGASQGIGLALVQTLSQQGAKIVLAARSLEKIEEVAKGLPDAYAVQTDMHKAEDITNLVAKAKEKYGRIDIFVNNAGQGMYMPVEKIDIDQMKGIMDLNVYAVIRAMQAVIPIMREQGGGYIMNISSRVSKNYFPGLAPYAATKYALNAITLTARQELAPDHIIVSAFHPRMTSTDFGKNSITRRQVQGGAANPAVNPAPQPNRLQNEIDTPDQVAEKIAEQIISEEPEAEMPS